MADRFTRFGVVIWERDGNVIRFSPRVHQEVKKKGLPQEILPLLAQASLTKDWDLLKKIFTCYEKKLPLPKVTVPPEYKNVIFDLGNGEKVSCTNTMQSASQKPLFSVAQADPQPEFDSQNTFSPA